MKRRILSTLLTLTMLLGLLPVGALATGSSQPDFIQTVKQTNEVPAGYTAIRTANELKTISLSGKYILMDDITLSGSWTPLGTFTGVLDGNGYTISYSITRSPNPGEGVHLGLFATLSGAEVRNLCVKGKISVNGPATSNGNFGSSTIGGLTGNMHDGAVVSNCVSDVDIYSTETANSYLRMEPSSAGGITGEIFSDCEIRYCRYLGDISVYSNAGGIAGMAGPYFTDDLTIFACLNEGTIRAVTGAGGIMGAALTTLWSGDQFVIRSCANTGRVSASQASPVGGILGEARVDHEGIPYVIDCLNKGTVDGSAFASQLGQITNSSRRPYFVGGIVGCSDAIVTTCINTGSVLGGSKGAICGISTDSGTIKDCHWLSGSCSASTYGGSTTGSLSTNQLKDLTSFSGYNFPDFWTLTEDMTEPYPTPLLPGFINTYLTTYTSDTSVSLEGSRFSTIMEGSGSGSLAGMLGRAYSDAHLRGANALWGGIDYLNDCLSFKGYKITNDFEVILADIFSNAVNSQEFQQILSDNILENFSEAVTELNFAYDVTTSQLLQNKLAALAKLDTVYSAKAAAEMREVQNLVKDGITHNSIPQGFAVVGSVVNLVGDTMSSAEAAMAEIDRFVLCNAYVDAVEEYGQVLLDTADQSLSISDQVLDGVNLRAAVYDFVDKMNDYARENYTTLFAACGGNLMDAATSAMSSTVDIIYWNMADLCPVLAGIKTGFAMGQLVGDGPTNMDGIHYYGKMLDMAGYMAQAMFKVVQNRQDALAETGEYPEAAALNAATDLYLSLQVLACDYAIGYCDAIYTAFLTQVMPDLFKINDEELVSSIQILSQKAALLGLQKNGKNITVGPDGSIHGFIAQCPVTVIVETKDGTEIARLSTGEKTVNDQYDDVFTLMGENMEMKCGFYDPAKHNVRIEGNGSGTMDLTLFTSNNGTLTSRQTYLDLPVAQGDVFTPAASGVVKNGSETIQPDAALIPNPFTDIKESDWFYPYVMELYSKNIVSGMTAATFAPKGQLTWGQALKLLLVGTGVMEDAKVTGADWAAPYVNKAIELGAISAADPNKAITRLEFCTVAAKIAGLEPTPAQGFTDCTDPYVGALVEAGVINGYAQDDGTFRFDGGKTLIRSEISKVISLLIAIQ